MVARMQVVGITTPREVMVGTRDRNFRINEYLVIEDAVQGSLQGEVVEAQTFNRFIPLDVGGDFVDASVIASLQSLGYNIDEETIYLAKVRLFHEASYPVLTGSLVRTPEFSEVRDYLLPKDPAQGMLLGAIRNTDELYPALEEPLKGIYHTLEDGKFVVQKEIPYFLDLYSMHQYPHIGIFGGSGSGKSFGLRVILEELLEKRIPAIVLDPHYEMDFSGKSDIGKTYHNVVTVTIGQDTGVNFPDLTTKGLKDLLNSSGKMSEVMEGAVDTLFRRNTTVTDFKNLLEDLHAIDSIKDKEDLYEQQDMAKTPQEREDWRRREIVFDKYKNRFNLATINALIWRFGRLEREKIFDFKPEAAIEALKQEKLVVLRGSTRLLLVFSSYLFQHVYGLRRNYRDSLHTEESAEYFPPFFVVTDEAHNFAPKGGEGTPARGILREISQEGRKYGVYLVLATQRPTLLDETITAQLNTKFIFRTVRASDINTIREETDLTAEETKRLPYLSTGDVFISSSHMGRSVYGRIRAANTITPHAKNPMDELFGRRQVEGDAFLKALQEIGAMPLNLATDGLRVIESLGEKNMILTYEGLESHLESLVAMGRLEKEETVFAVRYRLKQS